MQQDDAFARLLRLSREIPDRRSDLGKRHMLAEVLFLVVVGVIAGCDDAEAVVEFGEDNEEWFRRFLTLPHGLPSHDTVLRLLGMVPSSVVEELVRGWTAAVREPGALTTDGRHVAFDGQALRGSADRRNGASPVQMVSAYLTELGVVLGSQRVDDKSNEIKAIPDLIRALDLRGAVISVDAIGCQTAIAEVIREAGADYALQVKGNQPNLLEDVEATFAEAMRRRRPGEAPAAVERTREVEKGHGRIETRVTLLSRDLSGIRDLANWRDLAGLGAVLRERQDVISGKTSKEVSYFILSGKTMTAAELGKLVRDHWGIENGLHWSLDVVFGSDRHQLRNRRTAENFARIRRFAHGVVKQAVGERMSGRRLRAACARRPDRVLQVLAGEKFSRPAKRRPNRRKSSA
jgi:predicted transposase YbfD/YdcC